MGQKQLVITAFILVLIQAWGCNGCWEEERVALLELQASFRISWFPSEKTANCCDWFEINCDAHTRRVTYIYLATSELRNWYLNASLFLPFKQLTSLHLIGSRITGCLHNHGFERLAELKSLTYLSLSTNNFNNNILPSLRGLSFLKSLDISYNSLKGSIYLEELASLKNLETLDLSANNIREFVASKEARAPANLNTIYLNDMTANGMPLLLKSLRPFSSLKTLSLQNNNLTESTFRHESQSFKRVETLYLNGSFVDENFFRSLEALPSLKSLSFSGGHGLGNLQGLCNLNDLQYLDLSYNNLSGGLPMCLANLTSLQHLDLSYSSLGRHLYSSPLGLLSRLKYLNLHGNNFGNTLPWWLSNLTSLQYLDMFQSSLEGSLSSSPLGLLTQLQYLDLGGNHFSSTLPWQLENLTSLQYLDLSNNSLVGNLSSSPFSRITSLQHLDLSDNNFQIPISLVPFYNCSNLFYLNIKGNEFYVGIDSHDLIPKFQLDFVDLPCDGCGGMLPRFLYHQHNLQEVILADNKMRGEFPYWLLENNTRLERIYLFNNSLKGTIRLPSHPHVYLSTLDISSNCFNGQIPSSFGSYFPNLYRLDISHNKLNGSFPASIGNLSSLSYLDLSTNHLFGEIPEFLNCSSLKLFDISENYISGNLPMFSNCLKLSEAYLSKNRLHGSLEWAFRNSSYLNILVLNHNSLTGSIPKWIENLSGLTFLQLGHNHLDGNIPIELCMLEDLRFVDLSNNNLSGQIPPCVTCSWHIYNYPDKSIDITTKSFSYSYQGIVLAMLSGIDLSCNKLTGQIPFEFGNLTKIRVLNMSHNSFRGSIPSTFSNLEEIETLDLSHNNLEGKIPSELTRLNSISSFSLAYNNLSGRTPDSVKQFATFESTSYEGNPFLCGKPLPKSCEATVSPSSLLPESSTNNENDVNGFMDMEIFCVSFGVSYVILLLRIVAVLYINPYWRRAWFYFIERKMTDCYYFIVDLFKF